MLCTVRKAQCQLDVQTRFSVHQVYVCGYTVHLSAWNFTIALSAAFLVV